MNIHSEEFPRITRRTNRARNRRLRPAMLLPGAKAIDGTLDRSAVVIQHVRVDLCRPHVLMSEQSLNRSDVVAV